MKFGDGKRRSGQFQIACESALKIQLNRFEMVDWSHTEDGALGVTNGE